MFMSYDSCTYSDCRPCIVSSVLLHVKHFKAVCSVKTQTKADLRWKHWLNYWHRCTHTCKRQLMYDIDVLALNFNHIALYAHNVIASDGPKIRMYAKSENIGMNTDLMLT